MRSSLLAFDRITNDSEFNEHALALFQYQFEYNAVYRSYCDLININPSDVKEIKDQVKSVSYSILYMKAVKALQEAMTRIETLEAKVEALEGA